MTPNDDEYLLTPAAPETDRCPECRHAPHDSLGFCPNMASDNDCACTHGAQHPAAPETRYPTGAIVPERQRCICDGVCLDHCRACNYSGRDLEEPCIADPDWEPDDDDLARREGLSAAPETETDANGLTDKWLAASVAARKSEHHFPADCLAEAALVVPALLADLDAARERVRAVEGERDAAQADRDNWVRIERATRNAEVAALARAESAEAAHERLVTRMEALADEFDAKGRRGSAHFGADVGDTIRLWIDRDPRNLGGGGA